MIPNYHIDFQPQLVEEAVLRAVANHPDKSLFWREREQLYEYPDVEEREKAFQKLYEKWFNRLDLVHPLRQVFKLWPILATTTSHCLLIKARSPKSLGAELYLVASESGASERDRRTIVVQLTPELLSQSQACLEFFRHELLHIVDMLDPLFGYEPHFPKTEAGPAYDHFLQGRYGVLWDITIDGRLYQQGWLPASAREKHFANFKRTFQGPEEKLAATFSYFFDQNSHTHRELVELAQHPEKWLSEEITEMSSKGRCAICHFPAFNLVNPIELRADLIARIQANHPEWNSAQLICQQCVDLYEARIS